MDWKPRVRAAFGNSLPDDDVIEELAQHATTAWQAALADGRDAAEAERQVRAEVDAWARDPAVRRRRPRPSPIDMARPVSRSRLAGLGQDISRGFRLLRRQPGYSAVAILTMALGIGATTSLFSVAYGVLLKPLPWPHADRLVRLYENRRGSTNRFGPMMTNASYTAWRDRATTIEGRGAWTASRMTVGGAGEAVRERIGLATPSLFTLLGARPMRGSPFGEQDAAPGHDGKVILSFGLWQQRFGGRDEVIGRSLRLDGRDYRIVGVMPRTFAFPDAETRAWIPFQVPPVLVTKGGGGLTMFQALARVRPGVTPAAAAAEATARSRTAPDPGMVVVAIFGTKGPIEVTAIPLLEAQTADVRPAILVFLAAVALLLLTATANVASVQLARAAGRSREIAIRAALGAGGARLMRQLLIESVIVAVCGGLAGLLLTAVVLRMLPSLLASRFPRVDEISVSGPVLAFALGVSVAAGVLFGLLPALQARRAQVAPSLAEDGLAPVGGGTRSRTGRVRAAIMVGQIAVACVLLLGAAVLARSFVALTRADRGYDPMNVLTARLAVPDTSYTDVRRAALMTSILERVSALPRVTRAAFTSALPLTPGDMLGSFSMVSPQRGPIQVQSAVRLVSPDYFTALGLRIVRGRAFTDADTLSAAPVVVVNRAFADRYLSERAVGDRIPINRGGSEITDAQVIGVVENVRHKSVTDPPAPELYHCYLQRAGGLPLDQPVLVVRTRDNPAAIIPGLRAIVRGLDSTLAFDSISTMEDLVGGSLAQPRLYAVLLGTLAVFAVAIAAVGLFGVLGYAVAQRSRELSVRAALGARPLDLGRLVLRQGLAIALAGLSVGMAAAFAATKSLSAFLYGVSAYDTVSFVVVPVALLVVSGLACLIPARRAAKLDPVRVLRG